MSRSMTAYRHFARLMTKPYLRVEGPGWGILYRMFVGHAERDWLWRGAPIISSVDKNTGYITQRNLSWWSDRLSYFLGRWHALEPQLIARSFIRHGDTVVDVGANRGDFTLCASTLVGRAGSVLSFEPNPACVDSLRQTLRVNRIDNVQIFPAGLSDLDDHLTLMVPNVSSGEASFGDCRFDPSEVNKIDAPVRVGDRVLDGVYPVFIKIDVEGFEVRVLRGLQQTIRSSSPIILTEYVSAHLARCGSSKAELVELMHSMGYIGFMPELTKNKRDWRVVALDDHDGGDVIWAKSGSAAASAIFGRLQK